MGLEVADTIAELNPAWPLGSDPTSQGDDHLRMIKAVLQNDAVAKDYADGRFLRLTGGTLTGALKVETAGQMLYLRNTEGAAAVTGWRWDVGSTGNLALFTLAADDQAVPGQTLLLTRSAAGITDMQLILAENAAALPVAASVVTRGRGDARYLTIANAIAGYLPLTGGALTGGLTIAGGMAATGVVSGSSLAGGSLSLETDANALTYYRDAAGTLVRGLSGMVGDNFDARAYAANGTTIAARFNLNRALTATFRFNEVLALTVSPAGTAAPDATTAITREKGDARYAPVQVFGAVGSYALLRNMGATAIGAGETRAGSTLQYANASSGSAVSPAGTWRAMGRTDAFGSTADGDDVTLFYRVS